MASVWFGTSKMHLPRSIYDDHVVLQRVGFDSAPPSIRNYFTDRYTEQCVEMQDIVQGREHG